VEVDKYFSVSASKIKAKVTKGLLRLSQKVYYGYKYVN